VVSRGFNPVFVNVNVSIFPFRDYCETLSAVKRRLTIRHLLAAFAILGLVLGPLASPAMAISIDMSVAVADQTAMSMPEGMPCCPDQAPMPDCAKDCPFMALCATQFLSTMPPGTGFVMPPTRASVVVASNDLGLSGLKQRPPPRPPKL
jgi:hypothetical protein